MTKWSKVTAGQTVILKGAEYHIEKIKVKGDVAKITITRGRDSWTREVRASDKVKVDDTVTKALKALGRDPRRNTLVGDGVAQTKWAKPPKPKDAKRYAAAQAIAIPPDPDSKAEANLAKIGAVAIAETDKKDGAWHLAKVDPSTIEAHLMIMHGVEPGAAGWPTTYGDQLAQHADLHAREIFLEGTFHVHE